MLQLIKNLIPLNLRMFDTQTTLLSDLSAEMKTFYADTLIDLAEPKLIHDQFADKYPIPKGRGKTIEFRKYDSLAKATAPLTEGVTPAGNALKVTTITATIAQYGDWIPVSDLLEMTAIDDNLVQATKLLSSQAGRTLDSITRDVLVGGTNVLYAPKGDGTAITSRSGLDSTCKLTVDLVLKAATTLKSMNTDTIDDSYVCLLNPFVAYDLMATDAWKDAVKYVNPDCIYNGEIGKIGNVRFVESTEAKIWRAENLTAASRTLSVKTAISVAAAEIAVKEAITAGEATALAGRKVNIGGTVYTVASAAAGAAGAATITLTGNLTVAADAVIYPGEHGAAGLSVFGTMVIGAHAYATTSVGDGGLQHIVKQLGSSGVADALNQRASAGWKANKAAIRLVEQYMVRVECTSAYSGTAQAN